MRPHDLHHLRQALIGQLLHAAIDGHAGLDRRVDIAAHRLAIHPAQPGNRHACPSPPNHNRSTSRTSNIGTSRNAIAASRTVNRSGDAHPPQHRTDGPPRWSHHWRTGGPITLAELTSRWSHATGGRHPRPASAETSLSSRSWSWWNLLMVGGPANTSPWTRRSGAATDRMICARPAAARRVHQGTRGAFICPLGIPASCVHLVGLRWSSLETRPLVVISKRHADPLISRRRWDSLPRRAIRRTLSASRS